MLSYRKLERIAKGVANHRRIQILDLLDHEPDLSVTEISEKVKSDLKNVSEHARKLAISGLIVKRNKGQSVRLRLTPMGTIILKFFRTLE